MTTKSVCRCGWDGQGDHPCHALGYTCRKPAKQHFYNPHPVALSGMQMKLVVEETWCCDDHWEWFKGLLKEAQENYARSRSLRAL